MATSRFFLKEMTMKKLFTRIFQGRYGYYGTDMLTRFLLVLVLICFILSVIATPLSFLYYVAIALLIYCYFRLFSRNITKRYHENEQYLRLRKKVTGFFRGRKG